MPHLSASVSFDSVRARAGTLGTEAKVSMATRRWHSDSCEAARMATFQPPRDAQVLRAGLRGGLGVRAFPDSSARKFSSRHEGAPLLRRCVQHLREFGMDGFVAGGYGGGFACAWRMWAAALHLISCCGAFAAGVVDLLVAMALAGHVAFARILIVRHHGGTAVGQTVYLAFCGEADFHRIA